MGAMIVDLAETSNAGRVVSIWRYPVKSMAGEEVNATDVTERGLVGDRAFALVDETTGKVASAKNPRTWPNLFDFRSAFVAPPDVTTPLPNVRITWPDGDTLTTDIDDIGPKLSTAVGRTVRLARSAFEGATGEGYMPDYDWLPERDVVFDVPLPPGTFFDGASVLLVTTATLDLLRSLAPGSLFDVRRFRPNFVIDTGKGAEGFVENGWIGKTLRLGGVTFRIDRPCPRCVMTTLAQSDLPKDPGVLRTAVQKNGGNVGVYASVIRGGRVRRGDAATVS